MFWNLENYFDPFDDPATSDDEFSPMGDRRWSWKKFVKKRNDIAKVIISTGNIVRDGTTNSDSWVDYPALIAFAEVENRFVVEQLVRSTPLAMLDYCVIHKDSPDERGIDVALIYRKSLFKPLNVEFINVCMQGAGLKTRLIMYAKGVLEDLDTVHIFVNHWPSKFGGEVVSRPKREAAAQTLCNVCDSILTKNTKANIIIMGDFNDTPDSELFDNAGFAGLMNLAEAHSKRGEGTIKYLGVWEMIDMFMISANLLDIREPLFCSANSMKIYKPPFLMEKDKVYLGEKPFRCFLGPKYNGGISDHLPIILRIDKMWENPLKNK